MKSSIIALITTFITLSTASYAQSAHVDGIQPAFGDGSVRIISSSISGGGAGKVSFSDLNGVTVLGVSHRTNTILTEAAFPATYTGGVRVAAADLPATTESECMASTDFSAASPMNPDSFVIQFDRPTNRIRFSFVVENELDYGCKVVRFGDGNVDGRDFLIWQRNIGSTDASGPMRESMETMKKAWK